MITRREWLDVQCRNLRHDYERGGVQVCEVDYDVFLALLHTADAAIAMTEQKASV